MTNSKLRKLKAQFSAHVCYGQTAGCINMALGMEVGLGPGHAHCARWGPSSPPPKKNGGIALQLSAHVCCGQTVAHLSKG